MIVAFCGLKGSGKTVAAKGLVNSLGYERMSFADPLRDAAEKMFLFTHEQMTDTVMKEVVDERWGFTPRHALQRLGTEIGRQFSKDIWIKNLMFRSEGKNAIVIDDCRFPNEAEAVKSLGGTVIGVSRAGLDVDNHASELNMVKNWCTMVDVTIDNNSTIEEFHKNVHSYLADLQRQQH